MAAMLAAKMLEEEGVRLPVTKLIKTPANTDGKTRPS
jgi:hypothetical protein